jgi:ribosome maturation factor RimP
VLVPFAWIVEAKLVLTDALMKRGADIRAARLAAEGQMSEQQQTTE